MTAALSREVTQARRAMDESCMGTDEYEQAQRWADQAGAELMCALTHYQPPQDYERPACGIASKYPSLNEITVRRWHDCLQKPKR